MYRLAYCAGGGGSPPFPLTSRTLRAIFCVGVLVRHGRLRFHVAAARGDERVVIQGRPMRGKYENKKKERGVGRLSRDVAEPDCVSVPRQLAGCLGGGARPTRERGACASLSPRALILFAKRGRFCTGSDACAQNSCETTVLTRRCYAVTWPGSRQL